MLASVFPWRQTWHEDPPANLAVWLEQRPVLLDAAGTLHLSLWLPILCFGSGREQRSDLRQSGSLHPELETRPMCKTIKETLTQSLSTKWAAYVRVPPSSTSAH